MIDLDHAGAGVLFVTGAIIVAGVLIRRLSSAARLPPIVGYTLLGVAISLAHHYGNVLPASARSTLGVFAEIGLVALLFRVGLESNIEKLARQLRPALIVWLCDISCAALSA
ncbi:MAG: cation:proton antiporter, partial [Amphiplicatus sp.]